MAPAVGIALGDRLALPRRYSQVAQDIGGEFDSAVILVSSFTDRSPSESVCIPSLPIVIGEFSAYP